jgi:hypothetical protein
VLQRDAAGLDVRIRELQQLRGELRKRRAATTLDPEDRPPDQVVAIVDPRPTAWCPEVSRLHTAGVQR